MREFIRHWWLELTLLIICTFFFGLVYIVNAKVAAHELRCKAVGGVLVITRDVKTCIRKNAVIELK